MLQKQNLSCFILMTRKNVLKPRTIKVLLRGILTIVCLGQVEENKAKYKEIEVSYICLKELEPRIYLHTSPQRSTPGNPCKHREAPEADTKRQRFEVG